MTEIVDERQRLVEDIDYCIANRGNMSPSIARMKAWRDALASPSEGNKKGDGVPEAFDLTPKEYERYLAADDAGRSRPQQQPRKATGEGSEPYRVEADNDGCRHCGAGKMWTVIGPDEIAIGESFSEEVDAHETASMLSHAYALGRLSVSPATAQGWQTIETAPKDGTIFDVWLGKADREERDFYCVPGTRRSASWHWLDGKPRPYGGLHVVIPTTVQPTHWRPLPAAPPSPAAQEQEKGEQT